MRIKLQFFNQVLPEFLHAVFAAFNMNIGDACFFRGFGCSGIDLIQIFIAGNAQNGGDGIETVGFGVFHNSFQPQVKADGTTGTAFRLVFQSSDGFAPAGIVIFQFNKGDTVAAADPFVFFQTFEIFRLRADIRIIKGNRQIHAGFGRFGDYGARAGCTAGKQQNFFRSGHVRRLPV